MDRRMAVVGGKVRHQMAVYSQQPSSTVTRLLTPLSSSRLWPSPSKHIMLPSFSVQYQSKVLECFDKLVFVQYLPILHVHRRAAPQ